MAALSGCFMATCWVEFSYIFLSSADFINCLVIGGKYAARPWSAEGTVGQIDSTVSFG